MRCMPFCILEAVLGVVEVIRCVLLCMLEVVEGRLCLLEVLEVPELMRRVLLYILEGRLCMLLVSEALELLQVPEVMRCVLLCILEAVEGRLYLLEVPEVMRCVQVLCVEGGFCCGVSKFPLWQLSRCGRPASEQSPQGVQLGQNWPPTTPPRVSSDAAIEETSAWI